MSDATPQEKANKRLVKKLLVSVLAMFGFAFALVPLYDVFCDLTGLNGKTGRVAADVAEKSSVDLDRVVTVEFTTTVSPGLPWSFESEVFKVDVHPGQIEGVTFVVRNLVDKPVTGRAVPSLAPGQAAKFFKKTECFCFKEQTLQAGQSVEMPVRFIVDPDLPADVQTVTLSYTFFKSKKKSNVAARNDNATPIQSQDSV